MQYRLLLAAIFIFLLAAAIPTGAEAQDSRPRRATGAGLITSRLSSKQLKRWEAIKRLALAEGVGREPQHPTIRWLLEWAAGCGHAIYIELPKPDGIPRSAAGSFGIEWFDPLGKRHVAVIRLHLSSIDQAYVGSDVARPDGLIPMEGLTKEERYVEVLGHELAHAYHILSDLRRARMVEEIVEQTNKLLLSHYARSRGRELGPEMRRRLVQRDSLLASLETYADRIETAVWRELRASQKERRRRGGDK